MPWSSSTTASRRPRRRPARPPPRPRPSASAVASARSWPRSGPAGQAGVAMAELDQVFHAEQLRRAVQSRRRRRARCRRPRHPGAARLAPGGEHQHDAGAGVGEAAHRAPGEDRLVVGVGVHDDNGVPGQIRVVRVGHGVIADVRAPARRPGGADSGTGTGQRRGAAPRRPRVRGPVVQQRHRAAVEEVRAITEEIVVRGPVRAEPAPGHARSGGQYRAFGMISQSTR